MMVEGEPEVGAHPSAVRGPLEREPTGIQKAGRHPAAAQGCL